MNKISLHFSHPIAPHTCDEPPLHFIPYVAFHYLCILDSLLYFFANESICTLSALKNQNTLFAEIHPSPTDNLGSDGFFV